MVFSANPLSLSVPEPAFKTWLRDSGYARNYAWLIILFFACSLYQMPLALVGLLSCLVLWEVFKFCGDRCGLDQYPKTKLILIRVAQFASAAILFYSNVQSAFLCAVGVSYAVIILHASFRKLTPSKQSTQRDGNKRIIIK